MSTWLKEFHALTKRSHDYSHRLPLFLGGFLFGLSLCSLRFDNVASWQVDAMIFVLAVWNTYVGVFMSTEPHSQSTQATTSQKPSNTG